MRGLIRNKRAFHYAPYIRKEEIKDEWGNLTSEYELVYGEPIEMYGNISAANGQTESQPFGNSEDYDRVIVIDDPNIPIDELSRLWVDTDTTKPHNYIVKEIARSLNSVSIAIRKVDVNG